MKAIACILFCLVPFPMVHPTLKLGQVSARLLASVFLAAIGVCQIAVAQKPARLDSDLVTQTCDSVWYDRESGSPKPSDGNQPMVDVSTRHQSVAEESPWWIWESIQSFFSYVGKFFGTVLSAWRYVIPILILSVLAWIVFMVMRYGIFEGGSYRRSHTATALTREKQAAKIQDLPFELEMSSLTLLEQARKYRSAGDYSKAIMYLFSHLLVDLDHARLIRLARGKTNRVYLRELKSQLTLQESMRSVVTLFESSFFGKHDITAGSFEAVWSQLEPLEQRLRIIANGSESNASSLDPVVHASGATQVATGFPGATGGVK